MQLKKALTITMGGGLLFGAILCASTSNILGVGTMSYSELVNGPAELTARQFISQPGEVGGWHYHPGPTFNIVTSGTLTIEDGCGGEQTVEAGQAFEQIGGRVHRWKNSGSVPTVEYNMFVIPQGRPLAVQLPERRCGPPRSRSECRGDGWMSFDQPGRFANMRECIEYVERAR